MDSGKKTAPLDSRFTRAAGTHPGFPVTTTTARTIHRYDRSAGTDSQVVCVGSPVNSGTTQHLWTLRELLAG